MVVFRYASTHNFDCTVHVARATRRPLVITTLCLEIQPVSCWHASQIALGQGYVHSNCPTQSSIAAVVFKICDAAAVEIFCVLFGA